MGSVKSQPSIDKKKKKKKLAQQAAAAAAAEAAAASEKAAQASQSRQESLLRRDRGRAGTVFTTFRGFLSSISRTPRKTLLGE